MSDSNRQMKLGMFLRPAGHHLAAWRHPDSHSDAGVSFQSFVDVARTAERGLFDMLFSADSPTAIQVADETALRRSSYVTWIEPFTLLAGLAAVTSRIGLVCTGSTTYDEPYSLARRFASLDHISGGRAGWNLVTTGNSTAASNFSAADHMPKSERYRRAEEFATVVLGLFDSWADDAFVRDRASGIFFDPEKMYTLGHEGERFQVRGPLNVARSPQGRPVLVQAGASDAGRDLAAKMAEVVFSAAASIDGARDFYADVKQRTEAQGRSRESAVIMPGFYVTVAETASEARRKREYLDSLIHPEVGLSLLSRRLGVDLSGHDLDAPLPDLEGRLDDSSRAELLQELASQEELTIRQLYTRLAGGRGHFEVCGTPSDVADSMEEWFSTGAADGFNIMPPVFPGALDDFVDLVVPELQRRGLYRTRYEGSTLRDHLGLDRPDLG